MNVQANRRFIKDLNELLFSQINRKEINSIDVRDLKIKSITTEYPKSENDEIKVTIILNDTTYESGE